jgi:outer membrane protein TolC
MKFLFLLAISTLSAGDEISSLSLQDAETFGLQHNKNVQIAEQGVGQHNARKLQAVAAWFPDISFATMYTMLQKSQVLTPNQRQTHFFINQVQLNQPIFSTDLIFGMRTAKLYWESTKSDQGKTINDTLFEIRIAYYAVVLEEISLQVQQEIIDYLKNSLEDETKKFEAGKSTDFEVKQSKVALNNAIASYHSLLKGQKNAKKNLINALGVDPKAARELGLSETTLPVESYSDLREKLMLLHERGHDLTHFSLFTEEEIEQWILLAQNNRPEIQKANVILRAAKEELKGKQGRYLPKISGFADYGYYVPVNGEFFKQQYNFAGGICLNWDLFDSFKREFAIKEVGCVRNAAQFALYQTVDKTSVDIRDEIYQIEEALFTYAASHDALVLAKQGMQEAKVRLTAGTISPLQYRDATRSYAEANRHANETKYNLLKSYFQLRHDSGIDVKNFASLKR